MFRDIWYDCARNISWMHWHASLVMYPGVIRHFGSCNIISRGWSQRISPLNSQPPCGFPCRFTHSLDGPLLHCPSHTQLVKDFAEWSSCKALTTHYYGLIECLPPPSPALLHSFLVLVAFPLVGLLDPLFPGHSEFQHDQMTTWQIKKQKLKIDTHTHTHLLLIKILRCKNLFHLDLYFQKF